jgi:hypothetical protein
MAEPKTAQYWQNSGHQFLSLGNCDACEMPVEIWTKGNQLIPVDKDTYEAHYASCPNARQFRTEKRMQAGIL